MLIKNTTLDFQWLKKFPAVFLVAGQDPFQINQVATEIIGRWQQHSHEGEVDKKIIYVTNPADWTSVLDEANSFSLFSSALLLDIRYEKKTWEAAAKKFLEHYLANPNTHSLLLIRAANLPMKQAMGLVELPHASHNLHLIWSNRPGGPAICQWIAKQLQKITAKFDKSLVELIYQYTEGNIEATAQALKKLAIIHDEAKPLTEAEVRSQLVHQATYQLYDLADSCYQGEFVKALQQLKQALYNKTDPILILWILTQEIRLLIQLTEAMKRPSSNINQVAAELKIWPKRLPLYQKALQRLSQTQLQSLLALCSKLDRLIKSSQSKQIWQFFESIALTLSTGKELNYDA